MTDMNQEQLYQWVRDNCWHINPTPYPDSEGVWIVDTDQLRTLFAGRRLVQAVKCTRCNDTGEIACYPDEAPCPDCDAFSKKTTAPTEALQPASVDASVEPVAWRYRQKDAPNQSWLLTDWKEFFGTQAGQKYERQPLYLHPAPKPAEERTYEDGQLQEAYQALHEIADYAHNNSTGPAVPDHLWEIRRIAYNVLQVPGSADAIEQEAKGVGK